MNDLFIYKINGHPLGFVRNGYLYSPYGIYLGWQDDVHFWNSNGQYCGTLREESGHNYILKYMFGVSPIPQGKKNANNLTQVELPPLKPLIAPINVQIGFVDGFS